MKYNPTPLIPNHFLFLNTFDLLLLYLIFQESTIILACKRGDFDTLEFLVDKIPNNEQIYGVIIILFGISYLLLINFLISFVFFFFQGSYYTLCLPKWCFRCCEINFTIS